MAVRSVDLRGSLVADLSKGSLRSREDQALLAIPVDALGAALGEGGPAAVNALGNALGSALEAPARAALETLDDASASDVAFAINAALARFGLGRVAFEQWGDALVARWESAPANTGPLAELCAAALARCLSALTETKAGAVVIESGSSLRVLVADESVCQHVRSQQAKGAVKLTDVLATLSSEASS
ncbi:MAG: hypothetical protein JNK05_29310 [Myxococcales bacterium]|nr:hypothetical protein [Myxococcales bacterium]